MGVASVFASRRSEETRHLCEGCIPFETFDLDWDDFYEYEPWLPLGIKPAQWIKDNWPRFIYDPEHIVKSMAGYDYHKVPSKPGIYFLGDGEQILYVGLSKDVQCRLATHTLDKYFTHVWFFGGVPVRFLEKVEDHYIRLIRPPWNTKGIPRDWE